MDGYINCKEVFDNSNIITVRTKEFGRIKVIPVEWLVDIPLADVKEIKYGHWEYDPNGMDWNLGAWRCSECGCKNDNLGMENDINPYLFAGARYCSQCGIEMRKPTISKVQVGDTVVVQGVLGKVINISEYREPDKKYAVDIGADDLIFVGDSTIRKCQSCRYGNDNSGYCLDCYNSNKWCERK